MDKKRFLAKYMGSQSAREKSEWQKATSEEKRREIEKAGMEAWGKWVLEHKDSIVDYGAPLGKTKRIDADGISEIENYDAAYVIVQAESHEAAAKLFLNHPHFMIFPGDSVEIMECLPMPKRD